MNKRYMKKLVYKSLAEEIRKSAKLYLPTFATDKRDIDRARELLLNIASSLEVRGDSIKETAGGRKVDTVRVVPAPSTSVPSTNNFTFSYNQNKSGVNAMARSIPTSGEFESLVRTEVDNRIINGDTFTAYDITRAIRSANPSLEINHDAVRTAVRNEIDAEPNYELSTRTVPNTNTTAIYYSPLIGSGLTPPDEDDVDDEDDEEVGVVIAVPVSSLLPGIAPV